MFAAVDMSDPKVLVAIKVGLAHSDHGVTEEDAQEADNMMDDEAAHRKRVGDVPGLLPAIAAGHATVHGFSGLSSELRKAFVLPLGLPLHTWWRVFGKQLDDRARQMTLLSTTQRIYGALTSLHIHEVVHFDVRPPNIILLPSDPFCAFGEEPTDAIEWQAYLCDLGGSYCDAPDWEHLPSLMPHSSFGGPRLKRAWTYVGPGSRPKPDDDLESLLLSMLSLEFPDVAKEWRLSTEELLHSSPGDSCRETIPTSPDLWSVDQRAAVGPWFDWLRGEVQRRNVVQASAQEPCPSQAAAGGDQRPPSALVLVVSLVLCVVAVLYSLQNS